MLISGIWNRFRGFDRAESMGKRLLLTASVHYSVRGCNCSITVLICLPKLQSMVSSVLPLEDSDALLESSQPLKGNLFMSTKNYTNHILSR